MIVFLLPFPLFVEFEKVYNSVELSWMSCCDLVWTEFYLQTFFFPLLQSWLQTLFKRSFVILWSWCYTNVYLFLSLVERNKILFCCLKQIRRRNLPLSTHPRHTYTPAHAERYPLAVTCFCASHKRTQKLITTAVNWRVQFHLRTLQSSFQWLQTIWVKH